VRIILYTHTRSVRLCAHHAPLHPYTTCVL